METDTVKGFVCLEKRTEGRCQMIFLVLWHVYAIKNNYLTDIRTEDVA